MKIAVITAVFGGIDKEKPFANQVLPEGVTYERFFINEENTPVPLPNLPNRLKAKYFKTQSHNIPMFDGCAIHVWIDGNIEATDSGFLNALCSPLFSGSTWISIQAHHERATIGEEIEFILDSKNPYLVKRYGEQPLEDEYNHYLSTSMPSDAKLYSCNVFARLAYDGDDTFFDDWWRLCIEWSWFDQSAFSSLAYGMSDLHGYIHTVDLGGVTTSQYYTLHGHDNWNQ